MIGYLFLNSSDFFGMVKISQKEISNNWNLYNSNETVVPLDVKL